MCSLDDGDRCDVWRETTRKARKPYKCACCGAPIAPGKKYVSVFSAFDGFGSSERKCLKCDRAIAKPLGIHRMWPGAAANFIDVLVDCIDWDHESARKWRPMLNAIQARREVSQ